MDYSRKLASIEKAVEEGTCGVFNNWNEFTGVTKDEFLTAVRWMFAQPETEDGKLYREIGVTKKEPRMHYLVRTYFQSGELKGNFLAFYELKNPNSSDFRHIWMGSVSISPRDNFQIERKD